MGGRLFYFLLATARRADLAQTRAIGADHVLASLMLAVPPLQYVTSRPRPDFAAAISRITRGEPQPVRTASTAAGWEALGALREALWEATVHRYRPRRIKFDATPHWEQEVLEALERALHHAAGEGRAWAGEANLFAGLLGDPDNRAAGYLRENRVDPAWALAQLPRLLPRRTAQPRTPRIEVLAKMGVLISPGVVATRGGRLLARVIPNGAILSELKNWAVTQAIRLDQYVVTTAHLVLAILAFEQQLRQTGMRPASAASEPVLFELGAAYPPAPGIAAGIEADGALVPPRRRRLDPNRVDVTVWTQSAARAIDRAREEAGAAAGSLHLLRAALTETDDAARRLLTGLGLDPNRVVAAVDARFAARPL